MRASACCSGRRDRVAWLLVCGLAFLSPKISQAQVHTWIQRTDVGLPIASGITDGEDGVYDSRRGVIIRFAGTQTWEYDGLAWRRVATAESPSAVTGFSMAYDKARSKTVLFGGAQYQLGFPYQLNETWEYDGTGWTRIATSSSPPPRNSHQLAYDESRGVTVMFGGACGPYAVNVCGDTWEYDGVDWREVHAVSTPPGRMLFDMAYSLATQSIVLHGGYRALEYVSLNDTWSFDGSNWTWIEAGPSRYRHKLAVDAMSGQIYLFGGRMLVPPPTYAVEFGDTWVLKEEGWEQLSTLNDPTPRTCGSVAYDQRRGRLVVAGGDYRNPAETWELPFKLTVPIDIKPGSSVNTVNVGSKGNVPVAVFSTESFDATSIEPTSITLAGASVLLRGRGTPMSSIDDLNGDGLLDLLVHVDTAALQLSLGDTLAVLEGSTVEGVRITGTDTIRIIE